MKFLVLFFLSVGAGIVMPGASTPLEPSVSRPLNIARDAEGGPLSIEFSVQESLPLEVEVKLTNRARAKRSGTGPGDGSGGAKGNRNGERRRAVPARAKFGFRVLSADGEVVSRLVDRSVTLAQNESKTFKLKSPERSLPDGCYRLDFGLIGSSDAEASRDKEFRSESFLIQEGQRPTFVSYSNWMTQCGFDVARDLEE